MASATCKTYAGVRLQSVAFKVRSASLISRAGLASATGRVAWGGSDSLLAQVPWIPKAGTPLLMADGRTMAPVWDRCFRWLFEQYIGGVMAKTAVQIQTAVTETQVQVVATATYAELAVNYAAGVGSTASVTREVALSNSLAGAGSIPIVPTRPPKFSDVS